jgi:tetratricopeptide (TPR) repeat protein
MENVEKTEVIQEKTPNIPSNKPVAFGFSEFFNRNQKMVTYIGGGLFVLILAVAYYFYRNSGRERYYEIDSLNMALKGDGTPAGVGMITVADDYSGTKTGQLSHYYIGMAKLQQGKYQEAIDNLEEFHLKSAIIYPLALGGIGDAYSQLKDFDKAAKYYMRAAEANENQFTTPKFYKKAAMVYEKQRDYQKALDTYKKAKGNYKMSPSMMDIDKYIARARAENGGKE